MNLDEFVNMLEEVTEELAFNVGDRVRVKVSDPDVNDVDVGQIGTVIERSSAPWVAFDEPTRFDDAVANDLYSKLEGWKPGHMDCLTYHELERIDG